jgi:60 kDa SS-A/Ro ribonucleoprotein
MKAYSTYSTRFTPQSQPAPGMQQVKNNAGGFVFAVDDWKRLDRFLILGSEASTYYVKAPELTRRNADAVLRCIQEDGARVVKQITEVSQAGRAPKNDPALFALAMCIKLGDLQTRKAAAQALPMVARIGTHLFHFAAFVEQFGGWGRLTRRAVADWYTERGLEVSAAGRLVASRLAAPIAPEATARGIQYSVSLDRQGLARCRPRAAP